MFIRSPIKDIEKVKSDAQVHHIGRANGEVLTPDEIVSKVMEVL